MVLECAQKWNEIARLLDKHQQRTVDEDLTPMYILLHELDPELRCSFIHDECILPLRAKDAAESAFINQLRAIKQDLDKRMERALEPERLQKQRENDLGIVRVSSFNKVSFLSRRSC